MLIVYMDLQNTDVLNNKLTINSELISEQGDLENERNNLLQALNENIKRSVPHEAVVDIETHLHKITTAATNDGTVSPDDITDIKSYILTHITRANDVITGQEDTIAELNASINCFTDKCTRTWLLIFVAASVALVCVRNCAKYVIKVNQYTQDTVVVIDGDYTHQDGALTCSITTESREGERYVIPIKFADQGSCQNHIRSIIGKPIRIYYDNSNTSSAASPARAIIYPTTDVTQLLLKKIAIMCVAIFVFYFIYKKNLSHNVNVGTA